MFTDWFWGFGPVFVAFLTPGSGLGISLFSGSRISSPYFWELSNNFLGKITYVFLSIGSNFFLFVGSGIRDRVPGMGKIQDPGKTFRMGATLVLTSSYNIRNRTDGKGSKFLGAWEVDTRPKNLFAWFRSKPPCFLLGIGNSETFASTGRLNVSLKSILTWYNF
jgi:hypothetical protein